jgi:hypothetical protein
MSNGPRDNLRTAIESHKAALADVARADSLLGETNRKLIELLSAYSQFDTLDDEIREARAAMTVRAIKHGDGPIPTQEPAGFASRLVARDNVESELNSVRDAIPILERNLTNAKEHAEQCAYQIDLAAEAVFVVEAEELAARYTAQIRELREVLYTLRFMGARQVKRDPQQRRASTAPMYWGNEPTRPIAMPKSVLEACHNDCLGTSEMRVGLRARDNVSAAVSNFWGALHSDPDAQLTIDELAEPFNPDALMAKLKEKA